MREGIAAYPGAKSYLGPWMAQCMPYKSVTLSIEVFGGMANNTIHKPPHKMEVYNDMDSNLTHLLSCLNNIVDRRALFNCILSFPYSEDWFKHCRKVTQEGYCNSKVDRITYAAYVWYVLLASKNGGQQTFKGIKTGGEEEAFRNKIIKKAPVLQRLEGVQVWNEDAIKVLEYMKKVTIPSFIFSDSPYYKNHAGYKYNMQSGFDHEKYCMAFKDMPHLFMICGTDNEVYEDILVKKLHLNKYLIADVPNTMGFTKAGMPKPRMEEIIWTNYRIEDLR